MDVPGCDDGSVVVVVGSASSLVFRVFLVEVPACDDGSLVVFGLVFRFDSIRKSFNSTPRVIGDRTKILASICKITKYQCDSCV